MSVASIGSVTSALTQLQQTKLTAALAAKHHLITHPTGQPGAESKATTEASTHSVQLPQDTVTLSSKAQKAAPSADVDHDGDSH